ncbi:hypothetical protein [Microbacterium sp.]|uniref:hypothetical protein n=1 Tax=Microbacterium sp. TaxID=51671 RepID=UPI0028128CA5|nr:hypothetical protein [Microbacterium sp.]
MTLPPPPLPHAVFTGAWGDTETRGWSAAQAVVSEGMVTLWIASPNGWMQQFTAPASQVTAKSAAQRITLNVHGRSYPILADPGAVGRALNLTGMGIAGNLIDAGGVSAASGVGRTVNQAAAAHSFTAGGGKEFLTAMRASGARVSRLGYGAIVAIGCGGGLALVIATLVITVLVLNV